MILCKWLKKLESHKRPLLGPNVTAMHFWGILPIENNMFSSIFCRITFVCITVFVLTEYIDVFYVLSDINQVLNNLKITMLASVSVCKASTMWVFYKHWINVIKYVTRADMQQRYSTDSTKQQIISSYTKYCRRITYLYWSLMGTTVVIVMMQPILTYAISPTYRMNTWNGTQPYIQVVSSYMPFDKNTIIGHLVAFAIQSYASIYGGGWISSFDTNAMVTMVFFKGELEMIKHDTKKIFGDEFRIADDKLIKERLENVKKRHSDLMKHAELFNMCLTPVMLFYVIVCSIMLCVTAYQITIQTNSFEKLLTLEYLVFGIAQLFIYCWHSNDVLYSSQELSIGPYESEWWMHSIKWGKDIYILTSQFRKELVFDAGPFTKLTVATFIGIIKGAYSYYTLLSQSQMN